MLYVVEDNLDVNVLKKQQQQKLKKITMHATCTPQPSVPLLY